MQRALFKSTRTAWETPNDLFSLLAREFTFTLDVCATQRNRKCARFFSRLADGLRQRWAGVCWMNPPYGRAISAWIKKAVRESAAGATVVCLVPARTDTAWWQDGVMRAREIRLLRGRLTFVGASSPAPFPSAVAVFGSCSPPARSPLVVSCDWRASRREP